jgi:hypothetical protein
MRNTAFAFLMLLLGTAPAGRAFDLKAVQGCEISGSLDKKVSYYDLEQPSFIAALVSLASTFRITIGIEWVRSESTARPVHYSWKDASVAEMISTIVRSETGYLCDIKDGVVHVYRKDLHRNAANFLELRLDRFAVSNELPGLASQRLRAIAARSVAPKPHHGSLEGEAGSYATGTRETPVTLDLRNVTVRDILDRLLTSSVFKIWIVTFADAEHTNTGYLRSVSLWNPNLRNNDQPLWDLLSWDHPALP